MILLSFDKPIGRDGKIYREILRKCRIPDSDVYEALREADCDLKEMKYAFLETDGQISIMKESSEPLMSMDADHE